jgi:hypothetical protein
LNLGRDTTQTIFLFASPQVFVNNPIWWKLLDLIVQEKLLRFVSVDKIHLFVHFACSFWQEFAWLKPYLFLKLQSHGSAMWTTVPVLFMTATCNEMIVQNVKLLSGLKFHQANIFCPPPPTWDAPSECNLRCPVQQSPSGGDTTLPQDNFCHQHYKQVHHILQSRRLKVEAICLKLLLWLDCNNYQFVDMVSLVGTLTPEQKAHCIKAFVSGVVDSDFHPRVLCMTVWDNANSSLSSSYGLSWWMAWQRRCSVGGSCHGYIHCRCSD